MNPAHARVIIVLLALILAVLIFVFVMPVLIDNFGTDAEDKFTSVGTHIGE